MSSTNVVEVTPQNAHHETLFCITDPKKPGFQQKYNWFKKRYTEGLRLNILKDDENKRIGFIEYVPASHAWRPVEAEDFMFIHCLFISLKKERGKGNGSKLIRTCEEDARKRNMNGVCVMTSKGAWISGKDLFERNGYKPVDKRGRYELLSKKWNDKADDPKLVDWEAAQKKFKGWHLLYADQCPWHEKSVQAIQSAAKEYGIALEVRKITSSKAAKKAPSGFGVFSLVKDGKLLEDHYISETRFRNILKKELDL